MKWQVSKSNFILFIIIIILLLFNIFNDGFRNINEKHNTIEIFDTTYNIYTLDSIINNLIYVYEEEIIKAENLDDSSAVELFKQLCTGHSLYGGEN